MSASEGFVVEFLDVGHGNSTVVILPSHPAQMREAVVIDSADGIATLDCLRRHGVQRLRLVLATHTDADHLGGLATVIRGYAGRLSTIAFNLDRASLAQRIQATMLVSTIQASRRNGAGLDGFGCVVTHAVQESHHLQTLLSQGDRLFGEILYPEGGDTLMGVFEERPNRYSAGVRLTIEGCRVLLGGDLDLAGWSILWERVRPKKPDGLRAEVFLFPHHGAELQGPAEVHRHGVRYPGLEPDALLELIQPELVVISVGTRQAPGVVHPRPGTFRLLADYAAARRGQGADVRLACTELTGRCADRPDAVRVQALAWHMAAGQDLSFARRHAQACPCAGTVRLRIGSEGRWEFGPDAPHQKFVDQLVQWGGTPGCRLV